MRPEHEIRKDSPGGRVREHDAIGAGQQQLLFRVLVGCARDDRQVGMRGARRQRDVEVVRIRVGRRHEALRTLETRPREILVLGAVALDEEHVVLARGLDCVVAVVEHDEGDVRTAEFVGHALPDAAEPADDEVVLEPFDRLNLPGANGVRENRARVMRYIVDEDGAGAAFRPVATELRAGQAKLVAQRHGERFLLHHVHAPHLTVDVQRHQTLHGAWQRTLAHERGSAEQVGGRRDRRATGNHRLDKCAA